MSDGSGGERPALGTTIDIPAASSWVANQRLVWAVRNQAGYRGHGALMALATFVMFIAIGFILTPVVGILFCALAVSFLGLDTFGQYLMWRARGGRRLWASLHAGGVDISTETFTSSYPTSTIARWSIAGPALTITPGWGGTCTFDLRRYGPIPDGAVAELLASEAHDVIPPPDAALATWITSATTNRANRRNVGRLVPSRRVSDVVTAVGYVLLLSVPLLLGIAVSNVVRNGWDGAARRIADGWLATTLSVVGVMVVVLVLVYLWGLQKQAQAQADHRITVHAEQDALVLVDRTDGVHSRIPWRAVDRFRVDDEWICLVTTAPRGSSIIPVPALVPGGRELLVAMLESRGAAPRYR